MKYTISTISPLELPSFFKVFQEILTQEFTQYKPHIIHYLLGSIYNQTNFTYWLENNLKIIYVAKDTDGTIVGFAVIDEPYGGVSLCRWLGITHKYQKKGIGKALIAKWLDLAVSQKCHKIELAAVTSAKEFYTKAGLVLEGLRKLSYFGADQYVFGKVLGPINDISIIR